MIRNDANELLHMMLLHMRDLVTFVQFKKKMKNAHGGVLLLVTLL